VADSTFAYYIVEVHVRPDATWTDKNGTVWPLACTCGGELGAPCPVCVPAAPPTEDGWLCVHINPNAAGDSPAEVAERELAFRWPVPVGAGLEGLGQRRRMLAGAADAVRVLVKPHPTRNNLVGYQPAPALTVTLGDIRVAEVAAAAAAVREAKAAEESARAAFRKARSDSRYARYKLEEAQEQARHTAVPAATIARARRTRPAGGGGRA
jgi:hypothetical protein